MKRIRIVQAALIVSVAVMMVSCAPTRDYGRSYPPRQQTNFSLIISPYPGIVVSAHPSGRYYYRDPYGRIYWRGPGNRYYLDRRYMNRSYHRHQQYHDWRRYYRR